ncbi:MAG: sulfatase [Verrucomicrobiales bacterium]|nr:sulfatase [Verrucomicrobiales bacterium]
MRFLFTCYALFFSGFCLAAERPNILVIMGDDCTFNDLPIYGGENAKTPNIDQLATRGLVFEQAFLSSAMCQPCRAELFTGLYPVRNGCSYNHSSCRVGTKSLVHYLEPLGYRVGLAGKKHVKPEESFPFEDVPGFDASCVRNPTHDSDLSGMEEFIKRDKNQPFCLTIGLVEPHVPWVMGDASKYPSAKIKLPENLADTKVTRQHFSDYLAEITYMDSQIGQILAKLEESGRNDDTIVIFTSEQGSQFPGCKWTNWNTGLHTGLVVAWPGKIEGGSRTSALVQYADVVPTLIELAGGTVEPGVFDGSSFARVLRGETHEHREFVYGIHNNVPEGPPYPIRSVFDGTHRYIRNLLPDELYIEKHLMGGGRLNNPYFATWLGAQPAQEDVYERVKRYMRRPAEQVYLSNEDPYEMSNLAGSASVAEVQKKLAAELDRWMKSQGDPGAAMDSVEVHRDAKTAKHRY